MKKSMCITYEVGDGLYVNVTNRCTNSCDFCIRNNGDGAYGSDSLWLEREPSVEDILDSIFSRDLGKYTEIVFCGYGEPSVRLSDVCTVAKEIKRRGVQLPIRINTNGQSDLIHSRNTAPDYAGLFDTVSISLNTPNSQKYVDICHPVYKEKAFSAILTFAQNVKNYVQNTMFSLVRDFLTEEEISECERISRAIGVQLKLRDYISG